MGLLVDGFWKDKWYDTEESGGKFEREDAIFRNWVTKDGSSGPKGKGGFKAEAGRYHLYISHACPWANRTMIFRSLKGLEEMISVSAVHWFMGSNGWTFRQDDHTDHDPLGYRYLHQLYTKAKSNYTGHVTTPTLWDKESNTIVSNESADIIRMFNSSFDDVGATGPDYYPKDLRPEIDKINERVYDTVNNGVYKAGFATTQQAYDEAVEPLFETLDWLDGILARNRYLCGDTITEADWRLFTTLIRFDRVYAIHFKCSKKRISDYPNLWPYTRELYQWPGVSKTIVFDHIMKHYYGSHEMVNPNRIVPLRPSLDLNIPHGREAL